MLLMDMLENQLTMRTAAPESGTSRKRVQPAPKGTDALQGGWGLEDAGRDSHKKKASGE